MELSDIISVEAVRAPLKATSKKRLLQDIADIAGMEMVAVVHDTRSRTAAKKPSVTCCPGVSNR